ncbi:hypothetical protein [Marininema halotolerans]|uniref:TNF family profile domain-containing protein n=1 Tax=Marininema halotolerans TaxID=1155944 RepID=A0A1I6UTD7_9BACL|nr:hypothetical protein [Marininema halotolerans]SFT04653.1 hypothetical protein SAMN05444972_12020 [Marininema halotolerans]
MITIVKARIKRSGQKQIKASNAIEIKNQGAFAYLYSTQSQQHRRNTAVAFERKGPNNNIAVINQNRTIVVRRRGTYRINWVVTLESTDVSGNETARYNLTRNGTVVPGSTYIENVQLTMPEKLRPKQLMGLLLVNLRAGDRLQIVSRSTQNLIRIRPGDVTASIVVNRV